MVEGTDSMILISIRSRTPRLVLNELKWKEGFDITMVEVWYVHRGAPNNTMILSGDDLIEMGHSFFRTRNATIPYHRIFRITYNGETIFDRAKIKMVRSKKN